MGAFGISQPVRRTEDPIFLTGQGRYVDDIKLDDTLHAFVLRSPHAHANINSIDTSRAATTPRPRQRGCGGGRDAPAARRRGGRGRDAGAAREHAGDRAGGHDDGVFAPPYSLLKMASK